MKSLLDLPKAPEIKGARKVEFGISLESHRKYEEEARRRDLENARRNLETSAGKEKTVARAVPVRHGAQTLSSGFGILRSKSDKSRGA